MKRQILTHWQRAIAGILAALLLIATAPAHAGLDRNDIRNLIIDEARDSGVPVSLALAIAKVGSDFDPEAMASDGAQGIMTVQPRTAWEVFGVDTVTLWHPRMNVRVGIHYMEKLLERYGRWDLALAYYKAGYQVGTPPDAKVPAEASDYVKEVLQWEQRFRRQAVEAAVPGVKWPMRTVLRDRCSDRHEPALQPAELDDYDLGHPIHGRIRPGQLDDFEDIRQVTRQRSRW